MPEENILEKQAGAKAGAGRKKDPVKKKKQYYPQKWNQRNGNSLELDSLIIEYQNLFDRSNKLDNKVYITVTFCGFLFVFIIGLFSGISQIQRPAGAAEITVTVLYILACVSVMFAYAYVLIFFMRLLRPEQIIRMDPWKLEQEKLGAMEPEKACERMIELYRQVINENLDKLKARCDEFVKGLKFIVPTVILAFLAYALQLALQIIR